MATLIDVAKRAKVSKSTVSLVVNNSPLVKEETRKRVLAVIDELEYVPNNNARGLITKITKSIGVVVLVEDEDCDGYDFDKYARLFSTDITTGIYKALEDTDCSLLIENFSAKGTDGALPNLIKSKRVDGVIIIGSVFSDAFYEKMKECGLPFVMMGVGRMDLDAPTVVADAIMGSYLSVSYLLEKGHKNVAYLNCSKDFRSNPEHLCGLELAAKTHKYEINRDWIINAKNHSGKAGYDAIKALWESGARPDGIVVANATLALGAQRYMYEKKIYVPDDISIVVYGDSILCGYSFPALTAVNMQKEEMGYIATNLLKKMISGESVGNEATVIKPLMVERQSVRDRRSEDQN